jgi:hypothetical protein
MNTAVQLRPIADRDRPRCDLVHGEPHEIVAGELGQIALFGPDMLVVYCLRHRRRSRLYVFRTLYVGDRLAASVPGVRPRVRLLVELRSTGRVRLARKLFGYLVRTCREPSGLSDAFYVRIGAVLTGRLPPQKILLALLGRELPPGHRSHPQHSVRHHD